MSILQRHVKASVLQDIPIPLAVLARHLTPDELEALRAAVDVLPTNRRDTEA